MKNKIAQIAVRQAQKSLYPRFRHGAVLAKGGRVLTKAPNIKKTITPQTSTSTHAEIAALKRLQTKSRLHGSPEANLYVCRVTPANGLGFSRPCPKCMAAIKASGLVKAIYYSLSDGTWAKEVI